MTWLTFKKVRQSAPQVTEKKRLFLGVVGGVGAQYLSVINALPWLTACRCPHRASGPFMRLANPFSTDRLMKDGK